MSPPSGLLHDPSIPYPLGGITLHNPKLRCHNPHTEPVTGFSGPSGTELTYSVDRPARWVFRHGHVPSRQGTDDGAIFPEPVQQRVFLVSIFGVSGGCLSAPCRFGGVSF